MSKHYEIGKLFWCDKGKIESIDTAGNHRHLVIDGLVAPRALALDVAGEMVYWAGETYGSKIYCTHYSGGQVKHEYQMGPLGDVRGIAVDHAERWVYWGELIPDTISRDHLHPSQRDVIVNAGLSSVYGMKLDRENHKLYWVDTDTGFLSRADLDGSKRVDLIRNLQRPTDLAIDLEHGHIYVINTSPGTIVRVNLDGTRVIPLLASKGISEPGYIEVDPTGESLYWTECASRKIMRSDLTGANPTSIVEGVVPGGFALLL